MKPQNIKGTKAKGAVTSDCGDLERAGISRSSHLERTQNVALVLPHPYRTFYFLVFFTPNALLYLWSFNFNKCLLDCHLEADANNTENKLRALSVNKFSVVRETGKQFEYNVVGEQDITRAQRKDSAEMTRLLEDKAPPDRTA